MLSSCANAQYDKGDSYWIVDSQHKDCNVYMMIFYSGNYSFRIAQSGKCQSLSMPQFLKDYEDFLTKNKKNINLAIGNIFIYDCYNLVNFRNKSNINKLLEVTGKKLGVKVSVREQDNEWFELQIIKRYPLHLAVNKNGRF